MSLDDKNQIHFDQERIWQILELYSGIGGMHFAVEGKKLSHNQILQITFYKLPFSLNCIITLFICYRIWY